MKNVKYCDNETKIIKFRILLLLLLMSDHREKKKPHKIVLSRCSELNLSTEKKKSQKLHLCCDIGVLVKLVGSVFLYTFVQSILVCQSTQVRILYLRPSNNSIFRCVLRCDETRNAVKLHFPTQSQLSALQCLLLRNQFRSCVYQCYEEF